MILQLHFWYLAKWDDVNDFLVILVIWWFSTSFVNTLSYAQQQRPIINNMRIDIGYNYSKAVLNMFSWLMRAHTNKSTQLRAFSENVKYHKYLQQIKLLMEYRR
jgi:hypothetical protein